MFKFFRMKRRCPINLQKQNKQKLEHAKTINSDEKINKK
jgi:hypothetical protein